MSDLIDAACKLTPRNLTWEEWSRLMEGDYRPTCPKAPIPLDVIVGARRQATAQWQADELVAATAALDQLNNWLANSGQLNSHGVDTAAFSAEAKEALMLDVTPQSTPEYDTP